MADVGALTTRFDIEAIRAQFPILKREVNGKPLIYLDSAASAQKPDAVINAMADQARTSYANVHRGLHTLANETTTAFEDAREAVRKYINASTVEEIVFTKGATEGVNLIANGLASLLQPGDEILLSTMEHHANIVPWHMLRERCGVVLKWIEITAEGELDFDSFDAQLSDKTKLVALTHMSNVLGTRPDVERVIKAAHKAGADVLLDGCQAIVHERVDVTALDVDYYVFSGHKIYGPTGIGALYGKSDKLNALPPYQGGGEMIDVVTRDNVTYNAPPHRFEAGTPPILETVGLKAALDWMSALDFAAAKAHKTAVYERIVDGLTGINGFRIHGQAQNKGPVLSFSLEGAHPHDVAQILDRYGVAVRAGHHCAQPLMKELGVNATARASIGIYNTIEEADAFVTALDKARNLLLA